jgi:hypothetical protein
MHLTVVLREGGTTEVETVSTAPAAVLNGWDELDFDFLAIPAGAVGG